MRQTTPLISEEDQRRYQAAFWQLPENATWTEIAQVVKTKGMGMVLFEIEDWEEAMRLLHRHDLFSP